MERYRRRGLNHKHRRLCGHNLIRRGAGRLIQVIGINADPVSVPPSFSSRGSASQTFAQPTTWESVNKIMKFSVQFTVAESRLGSTGG